MNRKQLIIAAMATVLSVSAANATSNISGITGVNGNGTSGSFNIDPAAISGDVGYRYYDFFQLGKGDIANLIYHGYKNGNPRDLNAFINLVQNQIDINGVVNTVRNGSFHPGHAIFISPNGMAVGASGVLNVGTLSVIAPTQGKFNELKTGYDGQDYSVINNISKLRNGEGMNYGGNAPVTIDGTVIARNGVDIRGSQVNIGGGIVNGYNGNQLFDGTENAAGKNAAQVLFESLVNTDGIKTANALNNGSLVVIKSGAGENAGINISGKVANLNNNAETAITNHGDKGLTISGTVAANNKLNVYNNNATGDLSIESNAVITSKNGDLSIVNKGNDLKIKKANVTTDGNLAVVNNGKGVLLLQGNAVSKGKTDIVNRGEGGTHISGNIGDINTTPTVRIVNEKGKLVIVSGNINAKESVSVRNLADGTGLSINGGTITAGEGVLVHNKAGDLTLNNGTINVTEGNLVVMNEGNGKLLTGASNTLNGNGNVAVKNIGAGGMELNGTITNQNENFGETAINNHNGEMIVNGTITNNGNMGIHNRENGTKMTVGAVINNEGKLKFSNVGAGGLTFDGTVNNVGDTYVYNDKGILTVSETGKFVNEGNLYIQSRKDSTGINAKAGSLISNEGGNLAIKHNGKGANVGGSTGGGVGLSLNGDIKNSAGETAINNYTGNAHIAGNIEVENGNLGIINRAGAAAMNVNAKITQDGESNTVNIKNFGAADMTVNGEITHNGRLNVLANESNLILGGKIHNTGKQMTYAAARANGDGIVVKDTFAADSNAGGTILIKNITGQNGLTYEGTMNATNGSQAEVYNKVGDMTVTGNITGTPAVILNTGRKLTVTNAAELNGDVKIVNKGTESADVAEKFKPYFREKVKK